MPGIDSTVIELLKTQILGLYGFLKLSNKCHEIWSSDHFRGDPRKCSCFSKICTVQATLGVKNKWFFIRVPRGLFGFNISLPYVGTSSEWRWGSSGSRMVLRRCGVANNLIWFEISRKWAAPERCMYIGKSIGSIKKCVCTNVLWFLWKTRNVCIIMFQSFLKNIRKFQEHFSHDNSYHRNRCVLNYSQKSRHPVRSIVIFDQFPEGCIVIKSYCVVRDHKSIYIRPWHFFQKKFDGILFSNFPGPIPNPGKLLNRISVHPPTSDRHRCVWWVQNTKNLVGFYSLSGETPGLIAKFHDTKSCSTTLKKSRDLRLE